MTWVLVAAGALPAQTPASADTVAETRRLRNAGDFAAAAQLITPFAEAHPDSAGVEWLAAQTLYWAKRPAEARVMYERAMSRELDDVEFLLDFGRFLVETGANGRAQDVLEEVTEPPAARARALSLLGTLAYWNGDLRSARRRFIAAVQADSSFAEARQRLSDIEAAAASWIQGGAGFWHDDQPLDRLSFDATGGWFIDPLTPLTVRVTSLNLDPDDFSTETVSVGEAAVSTYFPTLKLDASAAAGVVQRSVDAARDWTGRVTLGARLPGNMKLRGRLERTAYTSTVASLLAETMVRTLGATAEWQSPRGWLGEATARQDRFPDGNSVGTGYAWLLAPLLRRTGGDLRAGYSVAVQDSKRSTFRPRDPVPSFPPGQAPPLVAGIYDPYYTPRDLAAHAVLASANVRPSARISLSASGSYGVSAHEDAPVLIAVSDPGSPDATVVRAFYRRAFNPWTARAALDARVANEVSVGLTGEHARGAFYAYTTAGVRVTWTFTRAAIRRAEDY
jgi:hypothetical protein